jgi:hypothetical protein
MWYNDIANIYILRRDFMKKFAKIAILTVLLVGIVLSFASCSFFTPSFEEMCENLADENYLCVYSMGKDETKDYDETLEEKYDLSLKGEVTARAEYTSGTSFIRLYEFQKKNDAMTVQQALYDEFMNGTHYGSGYVYRYYYIVDSILIETSAQSAAKAALDEAYVLVDLPNAKTEDVMDYFTSLFD